MCIYTYGMLLNYYDCRECITVEIHLIEGWLCQLILVCLLGKYGESQFLVWFWFSLFVDNLDTSWWCNFCSQFGVCMWKIVTLFWSKIEINTLSFKGLYWLWDLLRNEYQVFTVFLSFSQTINVCYSGIC